MADEFYTPKEDQTLYDEFNTQSVKETVEEFKEFNDELTVKASEEPKESTFKKLKKMGYALAACVSVVAIGTVATNDGAFNKPEIVVSVEKPDSDEKPDKDAKPPKQENVVSKPDEPEVVSMEEADSSFPVLSNLEPNGNVPGYGVLDEEYVFLNDMGSNGTTIPLWVGKARENEFFYSQISYGGARYDISTNTLYLKDFKEPNLALEVNLMGNGFTVDVSGDCELNKILVWGFDYCGSITITGDGSLNINSGTVGILLQAEGGAACLMVDKDVTLTVEAGTIAVKVRDSTMEKAIYYLAPNKLVGVHREYSPANNSEGLFDSDIFMDEPLADGTLIQATRVEWNK